MNSNNKLSLKKKKRTPHKECIVISDSEEEKENTMGQGISIGVKSRTPRRRESTILAGNIYGAPTSPFLEPSFMSNAVERGKNSNRGSSLKMHQTKSGHARLSTLSTFTEDLTREVLKENNESDEEFFSCKGSPNKMDCGMQNSWMTDITLKSERHKTLQLKDEFRVSQGDFFKNFNAKCYFLC